MKEVFKSTDSEIAWIVERVRQTVSADWAKKESPQTVAAETPLAVDVAAILNNVFWASLLAEEGRPCLPCVFFGEPKTDTLQWKLLNGLVLNPKNLAKLSSGTDVEQCWIGIHRNAEGLLEMWGIVPFPVTPGLAVHAADPGSLVVKNSLSCLALFKPNQKPILLDEAASFGSTVLSTFFLRQQFAGQIDDAAIDAMLAIIKSMAKRRLGGALLMVDPADDSWRSAVDHSYEFLQNISLGAAVEATKAASSSVFEKMGATTLPEALKWNLVGLPEQFREKHLSRVSKIIAIITRISSVDGAVVVDPELRLLGAGAKIIAAVPSDTSIQIWELDETKGYAFRSGTHGDLGGTRHQSAARFVHSYNAGLAFVVSQDGRVTLLYANSKEGAFAVKVEPYMLPS